MTPPAKGLRLQFSRRMHLLPAIVLLFPGAFALAQSESATPHRIQRIELLPEHGIRLTFGGNPVLPLYRSAFALYPLEVSRDLATWSAVTTLVATNSSTNALVYVDAHTPLQSQRFYRTYTNNLVTPFPKPTGAFFVGRTMRYLSDTSRTNRYNVKTNDTFLLQIWYPATREPGRLPSSYIEGKLAAAWAGSYIRGNSTKLSNYVSFAVADLPASTGETRYPVLLYSSGYRGVRVENTLNFEELSSHGYIVVSADHSDSTATLSPEGSVLRGESIDTSNEANWIPLMAGRMKDLRLILDELTNINTRDELLRGRLDLGSVGVFGWSVGGGGAAELARTEDRVAAVAVLDAYLQGLPQLPMAGVQKPLLNMYSVEWGGDQTLFHRSRTNAYYFMLRDSTHQTYSDSVWTVSASPALRTNSMVARTCLVSFFDKYLKKKDDNILDDLTNVFPVAFGYRRK